VTEGARLARLVRRDGGETPTLRSRSPDERSDIRANGTAGEAIPHVALRAPEGARLARRWAAGRRPSIRVHNFKQPIAFSRRDFAPEV
jgi:hypothetical protein